ncbi:hypothetical protein RF11_07348 [Thelohanellus kitauei]|uniref:Uncharacterized protein n=1 Tax=Thelohanellus kitauei TaxID=669202 RepID=A0A0C2IXV3_THEKT|nr:hypothetical protein RF11_07348 [Thelohanellus kitauei]
MDLNTSILVFYIDKILYLVYLTLSQVYFPANGCRSGNGRVFSRCESCTTLTACRRVPPRSTSLPYVDTVALAVDVNVQKCTGAVLPEPIGVALSILFLFTCNQKEEGSDYGVTYFAQWDWETLFLMTKIKIVTRFYRI